MQISMLKNKNLNRQKILLSPGAGNLRASRVENNENSVDEFNPGNLNSANQEQRAAVSGDHLINQLRQLKKGSGGGNALRTQTSFGA